jgi:DNA modification methylase
MHEFDLDVLGFEMPELDKFLNDGEIGPELFGGSKVATGNEDKVDILPVTHIKENPNDADAVPEVTKFDFVKPGDIWTLGRHRLMCGDSTSKEDVAKLMNSSKSDMVFTDPPYGIKNDSAKGATYNNNKAYDDSITFDLKQLPFLDCDWVIWGGNYYNWLPKNRTEIGWVVWDKRPTRETWDEKTREAADRIFGQHFEIAVTNISGIRGKMIRKTWGGFYGTAGNPEDAIVHRTQKPIELITHFLKSEHKIILDYFGGSGSTLIACEKTNRNCFMMELDPHYCAVILRRFAEYTGNDPVRESDGALLSDLLLD